MKLLANAPIIANISAHGRNRIEIPSARAKNQRNPDRMQANPNAANAPATGVRLPNVALSATKKSLLSKESAHRQYSNRDLQQTDGTPPLLARVLLIGRRRATTFERRLKPIRN